MSKEEQSIELVNPEVNKIKVGVGIGLILASWILLILNLPLSQHTHSVEIILRFGIAFLSSFGGVLIALGIGGQKYKGQWIKKREGQKYKSQWITRRD
ncbi:MAG: hypothetical protein ACFFDC_18680 [Promethearchaeota archaeon]